MPSRKERGQFILPPPSPEKQIEDVIEFVTSTRLLLDEAYLKAEDDSPLEEPIQNLRTSLTHLEGLLEASPANLEAINRAFKRLREEFSGDTRADIELLIGLGPSTKSVLH